MGFKVAACPGDRIFPRPELCQLALEAGEERGVFRPVARYDIGRDHQAAFQAFLAEFAEVAQLRTSSMFRRSTVKVVAVTQGFVYQP